MRQIDDPVRLRRRAANLECTLAAAPVRESTLAFLRGILEEVRFARAFRASRWRRGSRRTRPNP
jgi:hypothetical protein